MRRVVAVVIGLAVAAGALAVPRPVPALAAPSVAHDVDGDGNPDLVSADLNGALWLYPGTGAGGWSARRQIGTGWRSLDQVRVSDLDGDGRPDLLARRPATGQLVVYPNRGSGRFDTARVIGTGWNGFVTVLAPGDVDGDGRADLLGVRAGTGALVMYPNRGTARFDVGRQIGSGWLSRDLVTAVGDLDGNGTDDLVARDPVDGRLWLYAGNGSGGFSARVIGTGWDRFTGLVGIGDVDGDGAADVLAREMDGRLQSYRGDGRAGWRGASVVGSGWHRMLLGEAAARPPYAATASRIDAATATRMRYSHRSGCPVALADLRLLRMGYVDFAGAGRTGEMVVHADVADEVMRSFNRAHATGFPIRRMQLVDVYRGSDDASMAADNTSAYNCRPTTGGSGWSEHAYGRAVDVNPVENPYVSGSTVLPPAGRAYVDRRARAGVLRAGDPVVTAFARNGFVWGGTYRSLKDYQHFSTSGR